MTFIVVKYLFDALMFYASKYLFEALVKFFLREVVCGKHGVISHWGQ